MVCIMSWSRPWRKCEPAWRTGMPVWVLWVSPATTPDMAAPVTPAYTIKENTLAKTCQTEDGKVKNEAFDLFTKFLWQFSFRVGRISSDKGRACQKACFHFSDCFGMIMSEKKWKDKNENKNWSNGLAAVF